MKCQIARIEFHLPYFCIETFDDMNEITGTITISQQQSNIHIMGVHDSTRTHAIRCVFKPPIYAASS
jgi:hypothetical protein